MSSGLLLVDDRCCWAAHLRLVETSDDFFSLSLLVPPLQSKSGRVLYQGCQILTFNPDDANKNTKMQMLFMQ